jgi:hypothetical protein
MSDKITMQKVFDAAWNAFVVQRKPPAVTREDGICTYRDAKGNRCAVGLVMTDEQVDMILRETYSSHSGSIASVRTVIEFHPEWFDAPEIRVGSPIKSLNPAFAEYASTFRHLQNDLHDSLVKINKNDDGCYGAFPEDLEKRYREIAVIYNLTIPGDTQVKAENGGHYRWTSRW